MAVVDVAPGVLAAGDLHHRGVGTEAVAPSCTICPEVTATSVTLEPQAFPTVPISTPWSWVQLDGETTRLLGVIGNTQPEEVGAGVGGKRECVARLCVVRSCMCAGCLRS